jgi:arylsulfatase
MKRGPIFWQARPENHRAVRSGKWKLVASSADRPWRLYDMEADRFEMNDLSARYPEKRDELARLYEEWARPLLRK